MLCGVRSRLWLFFFPPLSHLRDCRNHAKVKWVVLIAYIWRKGVWTNTIPSKEILWEPLGWTHCIVYCAMYRIDRSTGLLQTVAAKTWGSHKQFECFHAYMSSQIGAAWKGKLCPVVSFLLLLLLLSFTRHLHHLAHLIMWLSLFVKVIVHCPLLAPISALLCFFSVASWWGLGGLLAFCRDFTRGFGLCLNPTRRILIFFSPAVPLCSHMYMCVCMYYLCNNSLGCVHTLLWGVVCPLAIPFTLPPWVSCSCTIYIYLYKYIQCVMHAPPTSTL